MIVRPFFSAPVPKRQLILKRAYGMSVIENLPIIYIRYGMREIERQRDALLILPAVQKPAQKTYRRLPTLQMEQEL
jgi:hypothetical protein